MFSRAVFRAFRRFQVFPHLPLVVSFHVLAGAGYMLYHAWTGLHVSERLALVTCFHAYYMFTRACTELFGCYFRVLATLTCIPALDTTGYTVFVGLLIKVTTGDCNWLGHSVTNRSIVITLANIMITYHYCISSQLIRSNKISFKLRDILAVWRDRRSQK